MRYDFEWDPQKNKQNLNKHKVAFEQATAVFRDPKALSLYDDEHSVEEDRWITLGLSYSGGLLVVHHTFKEMAEEKLVIRIFSARKATKKEIKQYRE